MSCEMLCMLCVLCYVLYALYDCFACFCQRTKNCARKRHVFASVCSQVMKGRGGVGGGGMLTFLVLLPLHVVTLHRCLAALLRCIHVALLNICMYIYMWICIPISSKNKFNAEAPALKRRKEKACQHAPMKWIQNPHETRILPNSRARIWHNSACRNVCFAMAKIVFSLKNVVFTSTVSGPPGCFCIWCLWCMLCMYCMLCISYVYHMYVCLYTYIYIYTYYVICIYLYLYVCVCVFVGIIYIWKIYTLFMYFIHNW